MSVINFSGIASGIDTNALIDATIAAQRQVRIKPNETRVSELEETNAAYEELSTKLDAFRTLAQGFSSLSGGGVSRAGTSTRESVVTASASNSATNGTYSVTVTDLARNHTYSFDQTYSSSTDALQSSLTGAEAAADRTVTFTVGTGAEQETVSVVVTDGSYSANDFITAFNAASSKAEASLVNVGTSSSPSYKIVISSLYEGTEKGQVARTSLGASLTNLTAYSESAATNAAFTITGIGSITRSSNTVTDVIPGVTLNLGSAGTATVKISEDAATTSSKVQELVDSFNSIVSFIAENNLVKREETSNDVKNVFAPLAATRTDDNALQAMRSVFSSSVASGGSTVRIFSDLGITTERDGSLKVDTTKLEAAIARESSSVSDLLKSFGDTVSLTGGTIDLYTRFNGLIDVTVNGNKTQITDLNTRIAEAEKSLEKQTESLRARYARLESVMGKLQQQQSSLTSALAGLGK